VVVVAMGLIWALLAAPEPSSLRGMGVLLAAVLVGLGVALGEVTRWRAWRRSALLDERDAAIRDRAYRLAFRGMGIGIFLLLLSSLVAAGLAEPVTAGSIGSEPLSFLVGPRYLVALLLLIALLPTALLAWTSADATVRRRGGDPGQRSALARPLLTPALAGLLFFGLWTAAVALLPPRTARAEQRPSLAVTWTGADCATLAASRELGAGLGAALTIDATICWNGHRAWDGLQGLQPPGRPTVLRTPPTSSCSIAVDATDFENISQETCTESRDARGTIRLEARAKVTSGITPWLDRSLVESVVVTGQGQVLQLG